MSPSFSTMPGPMSLCSLAMETIIRQKIPMAAGSVPASLIEDINNLTMCEGTYNILSYSVCRYNPTTGTPLPITRLELAKDNESVTVGKTSSGFYLKWDGKWDSSLDNFVLGRSQEEGSLAWVEGSKVTKILRQKFDQTEQEDFLQLKFCSGGFLEIVETEKTNNDGKEDVLTRIFKYIKS